MNEKAIEVMNDQIQLDLDAISAYEEAIAACEITDIRNRLLEFKGDHERHVRELGNCVKLYGGVAATRGDFKGFFIKSFTKVVSRGDRSALFAMRANEELTNRIYEAALKNPLPDDARTLLEKNLGDERRHLQWIRETMASRAWDREEERPTHAP